MRTTTRSTILGMAALLNLNEQVRADSGYPEMDDLINHFDGYSSTAYEATSEDGYISTIF